MTFTDTRRDLIALAVKTEIPALARRYRMLVTAMENLASGEMAENLKQSIAKLLTEIGQIKRDGFYANPLGNLAHRNKAQA